MKKGTLKASNAKEIRPRIHGYAERMINFHLRHGKFQNSTEIIEAAMRALNQQLAQEQYEESIEENDLTSQDLMDLQLNNG